MLTGMAPLVFLTMILRAHAQTAPAAVTVADYIGATVQIQDPIGSDWRRVPAATLPAHPIVEAYQPNHWVEVDANGKDVLISILSVDLDGVPVVGPVVCPHEPPAEIAGTAGLGGCSK
jgi:hypothetical protein